MSADVIEHAMPTTQAELKELMAMTLSELLTNPANSTVLARTVVQATLNALNDQVNNQQKQKHRLTLVRSFYEGAWKCTVIEKEANDPSENIFSVLFEEKAAGATTWTKVPDLTPERQSTLAKLVLATTCDLGDIWFLTTNGVVDAALEDASAATQELMDTADQSVQH